LSRLVPSAGGLSWPKHNFQLPKPGGKGHVPMTERLSTSIREIRDLTPKLNVSTDAAKRVVAAVEKFLEETNVGVPAGVQSSDDGKRVLYLSYERVGEKYRVAVDVYEREVGEARSTGELKLIEVKPWNEASRAEKLATFAKLPELLNQIADTMRGHVESVGKTVETVDAVLAALESQLKRLTIDRKVLSMDYVEATQRFLDLETGAIIVLNDPSDVKEIASHMSSSRFLLIDRRIPVSGRDGFRQMTEWLHAHGVDPLWKY